MHPAGKIARLLLIGSAIFLAVTFTGVTIGLLRWANYHNSLERIALANEKAYTHTESAHAVTRTTDIEMTVPERKDDCAKAHGKWEIYGCVITSKDGGKPCSDSKQCEFGCEADLPPEAFAKTGFCLGGYLWNRWRSCLRQSDCGTKGYCSIEEVQSIPGSGKCSLTSDFSGCHSMVNNGMVHPGMCADPAVVGP